MPTHLDAKANGQSLNLKTPLWRYMKLSTLLYMLNQKRAFIPKLSTLQHADKFEGWLDLQDEQEGKRARDQELKEDATWLTRTKDKGGTKESWEKDPSLSDLWLRELAKRRCIWCWHHSEHESMAQWVIYGREAGMAIRSDVESVLGTFGSAKVMYSEVQYVHPGKLPNEASQYLRWHPYFLKHGSFQHEREVRFVLEDDTDWPIGRPVQVDPRTLIKEVVISPLLLPSEATAVMDVVRKLGEEYEITDIKVSGGQNVHSPHGRPKSTFEERAFEAAADEWLKNGPRNRRDEPSFLSLIPSKA